MSQLEGKCADPKCEVDTHTNKNDGQSINCASPFCTREFHLQCAGLKGKKVNNIIPAKQTALEKQLKDFTSCLNEKMTILQDKFKSSLKTFNEKLVSIEKSNDTKILCINDKISNLEEKLNNQLCLFEEKMNNFEKNISSRIVSDTSKDNIESLSQANNFKPTATNNNFHNDVLVKYRIRISALQEAPSNVNFQERQIYERESVEKIFSHMNLNNITITDCFRLGKFKTENIRPRTLIVTFASVWDQRKVISQCFQLKSYSEKIFISPELSNEDKIKEKKLLNKRWQLIQSGVERQHLKIKNLRLFNNQNEVDLD